MGQSHFLDLVLLVLILVCGMIMLPQVFQATARPIVSHNEDKTAMDAKGSLYVGETVKTGADLFMTLTVTDEYCPFPKSIKINDTPIIDLNKEWVAKRTNNIKQIYNPLGQWKLGRMLDWKVESITYKENNGDPYLHYILKEGV